MEEYKLSVASSPHASSPVGTKNLMRDVLIALIPALAMGIYVFGPRALTMTLVSVVFCEIFEWLYCKIMHKPIPCGDLSAAITGVLLVFVCPVTLPYWTIIIGDAFAIIVVKQLFGGIGDNFLNPALTARAVLLASWPALMTTHCTPFDAVTSATPLMTGEASTMQLLLGDVPGAIGETCKVAILLGFVYLLVTQTIRWEIPVFTVAAAALLSWALGLDPLTTVLSGGLLFGAVYMATDYVTSPLNRWAQIVYAIGIGVIVVIIRKFGAYPEGVTYAILLMNIAAPLLDRVMPQKIYGCRKTRKEAK